MKLKNSHRFLRYAKNTGWSAAEKILNIFIRFFVSILVARYLGPEKFGSLSFSFSIVALFMSLGNASLDAIIVKKQISDSDDVAELYGSAIMSKLFGALFVNAIVFIIGLLYLPEENFIMSQIIAFGIFFQVVTVFNASFQARVRIKYASLSIIFALAGSSLFKIILIVLNADVIFFSGAMTLNSFFYALFLIIFFRKEMMPLSILKFKISTSISFLKETWPLILSGLFIALYTRIDHIMIRFFLDEEALGQYAVSSRITTTIYLISIVLSTSLFPAILHAKSRGPVEYKKRLQSLSDFLFILAVGIGVLYLTIGKPIFLFFFGDKYIPASEVLQVHIWSCVFVFLGILYSNWLIAEEQQISTLIRTFGGAVINIILNFLMIPRYGIMGAAISTLVAQFLASYAGFALLKISREGFLMQTKSLFLPIRLLGKLFKHGKKIDDR